MICENCPLQENKTEPGVMLIGSLNKRYGIKDYEPALPGHPVYEFNDRYFILVKHATLPDYKITFYKSDFKHAIDFLETPLSL